MPEIPDKNMPRELPERLQNKSFSRDDSTQWYHQRAAQIHAKDSEWMAKILVLGVGAQVVGRKFGVNLFTEAMHYAGRGASFLGNFSSKATPVFSDDVAAGLNKIIQTPVDEGGAAYIRGTGAQLGQADLVQDLAEMLVVGRDPQQLGRTSQLAFDRLMAERFSQLPRKSTNRHGTFLSRDVEALTVDDIVNSTDEWIQGAQSGFSAKSAAGKTAYKEVEVLKMGLDKGWIKGDTIIDSFLFKSKSGRVLDARFARPGHALNVITKSFDLANVGKNAAAFLRSNRKFGVIGPEKGSRVNRVVAGGNVYELTSAGPKLTATGKTLGVATDVRQLPASLREAQQAGRLKDFYGTTNYKPTSFFDRVQEATGIGPKFRERRSGLIGTTTQFIKSIRAVSKGEAQIFARPFKRQEENLFNRIVAPSVESADAIKTATGTELVAGKYAGRGTGPGEGIIGGVADARKAGITRVDRLKAYLGISEDLTLIKSGSVTKPSLTKEDLFVPHGRAGIPSLQSIIRTKELHEGATGTTITGMLDYGQRARYYAASAHGLDRAYDFANYLTIRLNSLASSSLAGIGFRPSGNLFGNMARLSAIPATYMAGLEAIKYTDYASRQMFGIGPVEAAADVYTRGRVLQQEIRRATGISGAVDYAENALFPGLNIGFLGSVGAAAAGLRTLERTGSLGKAAGLAGAIFGAIGGPDVAMSPEQLSDIYAGEEKVAIRKARFWGLGYGPFKGGQISHFAPSWYTRLKQKPELVNIYGSEEEYWRYSSLLPTPSNLFGLRKIYDPYRVERANYFERPYPVTAGLFEEVPIFGPILSDTVGSLIKPRKKMHSKEASFAVASSNIQQRQVPASAASRLGVPDIPGALVEFDRPDVLQDRLNKYANVGLEPTGIWKFVLESFGVKFDKDYQLASADNMTSISRMFYNANLGGLFGETEFIRRFLMSDYGNPSKINGQLNPLANAMPRWLPGSLSENEQDRGYFYDFSRGDAYSKIMGGEYRLPGAGYEAVNKLHSGTPGVYDEVDKFRILADVAPYSAAYYKAEGAVQKMNLSPYWQKKVEQSLQNREDKIQKFDFYRPQSMAEDYAERIGDYNAIGGVAQTIRTGWAAAMSDGLAQIPIAGSKFFNYRDPIDHYRKYMVEGDSFADWSRPVETIVRPAFYDVMGSNPFVATVKGAGLMALASGALPGTSVARYLNPIQAATNNQGASIFLGAVLGGATSTMRMASTQQLTGGFIPGHVQQERETLEYFDRLKYAKYRMLQERAEEAENYDLARSFAAEGRRTSTFGLSKFRMTGDPSAYARTLDSRHREYFEAFIQAPPGRRSEILGLVPDHMREVLADVYGNYSVARNSGRSAMAYRAADELTSEYFRDHALPDEDWIGWNPSIPETAIQIRAIEGGINGVSDNIHRFNFYPNQKREVDLRFPSLAAGIPENIHSPTASGLRLWLRNTLRGDDDRVFSGVANFGQSIGGNAMNSFIVNMNDHRKDDVMAFIQDIYR